MDNHLKKPILVTGAHRSGSTWVGQMISLSPEVGYIHEPFNIDSQSGLCGGQFEYWFTYVCNSNSSRYYPHVKNCIEYKCSLLNKLDTLRYPKNFARHVQDYGRFSLNRVQGKRPLIKDPIAVFSADWLASTFEMEVIVLIRHPAAFASSIKRANWPHPFNHFLQQPLLMRDHLSSYAAEIELMSTRDTDIIDQAILLWNIIHATILEYRRSHSDWYFVRHEDISADPVQEFGAIFQQIDLDYPQSIQNEISKFSHARGFDKLYHTLLIERDSKATVTDWKSRLSTEEIDRVRKGTALVSRHFYQDNDWKV